MAYVYYNPNPKRRRTDDCIIRAICKFTDKNWYHVYVQLSIEGFIICDWGLCNEVWGSYLKKQGYTRKLIPDKCPACYSVEDFCKDHPTGKYLLSTGEHTIAVINGDYFDTWDSGDEVPIYFWE